MSEAAILAAVRIALSKAGAVVFRNNVALAWVGRPIKILRRQQIWVSLGDVVLQQARPLHAGLCVGSSDLIGFKSVLVTPDMVGSRVAIFTAVECKDDDGRATTDQSNFLERVEMAGGIAMLVRSSDDAVSALAAK
jgi:hypothetical protein